MDGPGWVSSHSWRAPAGLFLAHIRPPDLSLRALHAGFSAPTQKGLVRESEGCPAHLHSAPPPFPGALAGVWLCRCRKQEEGLRTRWSQRSGCKRQPRLPIPGLPCSRCLLPASALRAPSLTPAPLSLHPPPFTSPHFPDFSPSLPLFLPRLGFRVSYWEPGDRPGFILGKSIHDRGYHSNKLPWCLDTR